MQQVGGQPWYGCEAAFRAQLFLVLGPLRTPAETCRDRLPALPTAAARATSACTRIESSRQTGGCMELENRSAALAGMVAQVGDAPPLPRFDAWTLALLESEIEGCYQGQQVPSKALFSRWAEARAGLEAATKADDDAHDCTGGGVPFLSRPLLQLSAARRCLLLRPAIESGDGGAVVEALAICAAHALTAPGWLAGAFVSRYERVALGEANSWDDNSVFGAAVPRGTNVAGVRARKQLAPKAYKQALRLLAAEPSRPIDKGFYEAVGATVNLGATQAERLVSQYAAESEGMWPSPSALKSYLLPGVDLGDALLLESRARFSRLLEVCGLRPCDEEGPQKPLGDSQSAA